MPLLLTFYIQFKLRFLFSPGERTGSSIYHISSMDLDIIKVKKKKEKIILKITELKEHIGNHILYDYK